MKCGVTEPELIEHMPWSVLNGEASLTGVHECNDVYKSTEERTTVVNAEVV